MQKNLTVALVSVYLLSAGCAMAEPQEDDVDNIVITGDVGATDGAALPVAPQAVKKTWAGRCCMDAADGR